MTVLSIETLNLLRFIQGAQDDGTYDESILAEIKKFCSGEHDNLHDSAAILFQSCETETMRVAKRDNEIGTLKLKLKNVLQQLTDLEKNRTQEIDLIEEITVLINRYKLGEYI